MQQCQLLRQAITFWRNPSTWCYDVLPLVCAKNSAYVSFALRTRQRQMHAVYRCFGHYRMLTYKISACEVCMICRKPTEACKTPLTIAESRIGKPAMVTLKIQPDCSTVHDTFLWANIYVRSHLGCGTDSVSSVFCKSPKYFKDAKVEQINRILKIS